MLLFTQSRRIVCDNVNKIHNIMKIVTCQIHQKVYPRRIFSGIQPTGQIHIGNYLGAIKEWVRLQDTNVADDTVWSIVDMHAFTLPKDAEELRENILKMTATLLACGINPEKSIVFQQSTVPMHAELSWILGCMTTMPRLAQLPQFKEKSAKLKDIPLGLYIYPVLQCADILLYKATDVPVGEDQLQHLHLAQHLVQYFNTKYDDTFPTPKPIINKFCGRIKSLREPTKKMSKSSEYKKSCIYITDSPETIREYVKKSLTDFTAQVTYDPETRPGVSNLITIHSLLTDKTPEVICNEVADLDTGKYKLLLIDVINQQLTPIRDEYQRLLVNRDYLNNVLKEGTVKAQSLAEVCLNEVKEKIGFSGGILSSNSILSPQRVKN